MLQKEEEMAAFALMVSLIYRYRQERGILVIRHPHRARWNYITPGNLTTAFNLPKQ